MTTLKTAVKKARWLEYLASYADVLLAFQAVLPNERLLTPALKNVDQSRHLPDLGDLRLQKRSEKVSSHFEKEETHQLTHTLFC